MRLINWPLGAKITDLTLLTGPRTRGAGTESGEGFIQTISSPFGAQVWRFDVIPMKGPMFRAWRSFITSLHGGANPTRVSFFDPDKPAPKEIGLTGDNSRYGVPRNWSNDLPWSNGQPWGAGYGLVPVQPAAFGSTIVQLNKTLWGHLLKDEIIGFAPFHFGFYQITQVIAPGTYRIWPSLRKSLTASDFATLDPIAAMRLKSENSTALGRNVSHADGLYVEMVEVADYDVREALA